MGAPEAKPRPRFTVPAHARKLESVALRPGISIYLPPYSYTDSLHIERHRKLRMYDVGPHCLLQSVDDAGDVTAEAELLWHSVWWRKVAG